MSWPYGTESINLSEVSLKDEHLLYLVRRIDSGKETAASISKKFNLSRKSLNTRLCRFRKGGNVCAQKGRPPRIDATGSNILVRKLTGVFHDLRAGEFAGICREQAVATAQNRGDIDPSQVKAVSSRTLERLKAATGIKTGTAVATTVARAESVADVRNMGAFLAMCLLLTPMCHPALILNADATQYEVGYKAKKIECVYLPGEGTGGPGQHAGPLKVLPVKGAGVGMAFFIKYMGMICAWGLFAPPVYIVASAGMPVGEFDVYNVDGLGFGADASSCFGYVVFCKTRCASESFFDWFVVEVVIPFVLAMRKRFGLAADSMAWFMHDGETLQLAYAMDAAIQTKLEAATITTTKLVASRTETDQAMDNGDTFKDGKGELKRVTDDDIDDADGVTDRLKSVLKDHEVKFKTKWSAPHKKALINGLQRVHLAQMETMSVRKVRTAFANTGVYKRGKSGVVGGVDIDRFFFNCRTRIGVDEKNAVLEQIPKLSKLTAVQGELYDNDFDKAGIRVTSLKDTNVLHRRRCVILTNKMVIAEELNKKADKAAAAEVKKDNKAKRKVIADEKKAKKARVAVAEDGADEEADGDGGEGDGGDGGDGADAD
jgi:hypothetical protein